MGNRLKPAYTVDKLGLQASFVPRRSDDPRRAA
jgi:hypothetical protein